MYFGGPSPCSEVWPSVVVILFLTILKGLAYSRKANFRCMVQPVPGMHARKEGLSLVGNKALGCGYSVFSFEYTGMVSRPCFSVA